MSRMPAVHFKKVEVWKVRNIGSIKNTKVSKVVAGMLPKSVPSRIAPTPMVCFAVQSSHLISSGATSLMLTPLDGVEVNTLLHKLPQGTQLTQESDALLDGLEHVVNLGVSGETADSETNTAVGALVTAAKGAEDV